MRKHWRKIAAVAAILLIFVIPALLSPTLEECVNAIPSYETYQHEPEGLSYFQFSLLTKVRCTGGFIDENSDPIIAIFTIVLTLSTALLWIDTRRLARGAEKQERLTQESINLARDEFVSSHRPKVVLREAFTGTYVKGEEIVVLIHVANIGETGAIVQHSQVSATNQAIDDPWPGFLPTITNQTDLTVFPLAPGESRIIRLKEQPELVWNEGKYRGKYVPDPAGGGWQRPTTAIFLTGQILYVDEMGKRPRRTAFRRKLDFDKRRFYRVDGEPDFEYAD